MTNKKQAFIFSLTLILLSTVVVSATEYGTNYEKDCIGEACTATVYSYQKYYQDNNQWKQINGRFSTENCEQGYEYCVDQNLYQMHIKNIYGAPMISYGDTKVSFTLNSIGNLALSAPSVSIKDNQAVYINLASGIDLKYTYLPRKIKEEIIVKDSTLFKDYTSDINIQFTLDPHGKPIIQGNNIINIGDLYINDLVVYDEHDSMSIPFTLQNNTLTLSLPLNWVNY